MNYHCINCWDKYLFNNGVLVVYGLAIINKWIDMDNALPITYSFN